MFANVCLHLYMFRVLFGGGSFFFLFRFVCIYSVILKHFYYFSFFSFRCLFSNELGQERVWNWVVGMIWGKGVIIRIYYMEKIKKTNNKKRSRTGSHRGESKKAGDQWFSSEVGRGVGT